MSRRLPFFAGLLWTMVPALPANACTCAPLNSVSDEFQASDAVFLGEVIYQELVGASKDRKIWFRVLRSWKTVRSREVCVSTPPDSAGCGINAPPRGAQVLVYARGEGTGLSVNSCDRTGRQGWAVDDVDTLESLGFEELPLDGFATGDFDGDGKLGLFDFSEWHQCFVRFRCGVYCDFCCWMADLNRDGHIDLRDFAIFQTFYTGD